MGRKSTGREKGTKKTKQSVLKAELYFLRAAAAAVIPGFCAEGNGLTMKCWWWWCCCTHLLGPSTGGVDDFFDLLFCPSAGYIIGLTVPRSNNLVPLRLGLLPERRFVFVPFFVFLLSLSLYLLVGT